MEFVGVLASAAQLLDQTIGLLGRIRRAYQRQKALPQFVAQHEGELKSLVAIIDVIDAEETLRTAEVGVELARLKEVGEKLFKLLTELHPKIKTSVQQFAHQLTNGSSDESKLSNIMNELAHVKSMLLLRIQVTNVGVMRDVQKRLVANTKVIERVDEFLREEIEGCEGLRIARLLQGRRPSNDDTILLTPADMRSLRDAVDGEDSGDETLVEDSGSERSEFSPKRVSTERIILRNMAKDQALQINAAIGEDIWKEIDRIAIEDNVASNDAVQINHSNTLEVTLALLKVTYEMRTATNKRRDSVLSPP
ncbi:hypothetical protein IQ06DRAFT_125905 [Phaeosphaeriaceae sp. SRC1lsM3a]|nr:hypothetical protein IQ06DRAFT_125905 [Stagonospora sp. SRC1lsM3a]